MNIPNEHGGGNPSGAALQDNEAPEAVKRDKLEPITPVEFFQGVAVNQSHAIQAIITTGRDGTPNDCNWCKPENHFPTWAAEKAAGRKPAYYSEAAYQPDKV